MIDLSARLTRLDNAVDAIKASITSKGQAVSGTDNIESLAAKIDAISTLPTFPGVSFTGEYKRRIVEYNDDLYFEWEFRTSGALTVADSTLCDLYLIGPGGNGGNAIVDEYDQQVSGGGGGAGNQTSVLDQELDGTYAVVVGTPGTDTSITIGETTHTANKGGNGSATTATTQHGSGFTGTYYIYGDENYPVGNADYSNAAYGTNGASGLSDIKPLPATSGSPTRPHNSGTGYGAGGCGGMHNPSTFPSIGAQGVVLMRIKI